jgi:putative copper export protein
MRLWGIWLFLHLIGVALWLGGMFTLSLMTSRARAV